MGSKVEAGYCVYGLASFLYYSIYPPVRASHQCSVLFSSSGKHVWLYTVHRTFRHLRTSLDMQLLYITFLAEFFSDNEGLDMDMMYYSEMKDAGYFEDSYEQF